MNELVLALKDTGYSSTGMWYSPVEIWLDCEKWFLYDRLVAVGVMTAKKDVYESYFNEILQRQTFFCSGKVYLEDRFHDHFKVTM